VRLGKNIQQQTDRSFLIVGPAGSGKTTFCRWSALNDAERYMTREAKVIPVYVPLHRVARIEVNSFEETFLSSLGESALLSAEARQEFLTGDFRLRLYLDGLDEVPDLARRQALMELAREGLHRYPQPLQVIVTSRDHVIGPWLSWLPRVVLDGLEPQEIRSLTRQWLEEPRLVAQFEEQLKRLPSLRILMRTPLLATLILLVFRRIKQLPESKARLYRDVVELLSGGWDLAKGVPRNSRFGRDTKILVLTAIAADIHHMRRKEFGRTEIVEAASRVVRGLATEALQDLEMELLEDGVISGVTGTYQFSHLSFQEYLVARSILGDPTETGLREVLAGVLNEDDWWREVFRFYVALVGNPFLLCAWLRPEILNKDTSVKQRDDIIQMITDAHPSFPVEDVLLLRDQNPGLHSRTHIEF
jgi:predicted NACHT family NTPase